MEKEDLLKFDTANDSINVLISHDKESGFWGYSSNGRTHALHA